MADINFEVMAFPVLLMDKNGRRIYADYTCVEYFKRSREEFINPRLEEIYARKGIP